MKSTLLLILIVCLVAASAFAQQHVVVPSAYATANGESRALVPGLMSTGREQILIAAGHLVSVQGQAIQAIEFRRHAFDQPFAAGTAFLTVTMSTTAVDPLASSQVFAANVGPSPVQVFSGSVSAPASPAPGTAVVAWVANNVVRVPLQVPFVYAGGTLCIDVTGTLVPGQSSSFWTADAAVVASDGFAVDMGPGTGPRANSLGQWSYIRSSELSPGSDVEMSAFGEANSFCLAVLGRPAAVPIPLNALGIGAPGAMAYIDEVYQSNLAILLAPDVPIYQGGIGYWDLFIPNQAWILGAELATQWLDLMTWDVSNGIRWTVATAPPSLGISQVTGSPLDSVGQRTVNVAHILRFEYTTP